MIIIFLLVLFFYTVAHILAANLLLYFRQVDTHKDAVQLAFLWPALLVGYSIELLGKCCKPAKDFFSHYTCEAFKFIAKSYLAFVGKFVE